MRTIIILTGHFAAGKTTLGEMISPYVYDYDRLKYFSRIMFQALSPALRIVICIKYDETPTQVLNDKRLKSLFKLGTVVRVWDINKREIIFTAGHRDRHGNGYWKAQEKPDFLKSVREYGATWDQLLAGIKPVSESAMAEYLYLIAAKKKSSCKSLIPWQRVSQPTRTGFLRLARWIAQSTKNKQSATRKSKKA